MKSLESLRVAKQCPASWDSMDGDDQVRHCGSCDRKVYNLSNMTREEAETLVSGVEGRMCIRFLRQDGMVSTRDCGEPIRTRKNFGLALAALPLLAALGGNPAQGDHLAAQTASHASIPSKPITMPPVPYEYDMGEMSVVPPPPAPKTGFAKMLSTFERWGSKARHLVFK